VLPAAGNSDLKTAKLLSEQTATTASKIQRLTLGASA
jgi:hypothetical protein